MLKTPPAWLRAKCTRPADSIPLATDPATVPPYVVVGAHGFSSAEPSVLDTALRIADAHATAVSALADPTLWATAATQFDAISALTPIPSAGTQPVAKLRQLNVLALADNAGRVAAACRTAAMYHTPATHANIDLLAQMATQSREAVPFNVVDHASIVSRHAVLTCEAELTAANAAVVAATSDNAAETASTFQRHVANAELAYGCAHPSTVSPELKTLYATAQNRVATSYAATYPSILKTVSATYVPIGFT